MLSFADSFPADLQRNNTHTNTQTHTHSHTHTHTEAGRQRLVSMYSFLPHCFLIKNTSYTCNKPSRYTHTHTHTHTHTQGETH